MCGDEHQLNMPVSGRSTHDVHQAPDKVDGGEGCREYHDHLQAPNVLPDDRRHCDYEDIEEDSRNNNPDVDVELLVLLGCVLEVQ